MTLALLLALALPLLAETPQASVARVLARAEALVAAQTGKDAREIHDLDRKAEALSKELAPLGWRAIAPLADAAKDLKRPAKVRLLAASFLALTRDPLALPPLEAILLDPEQPPFVRSLAAQSLPGLDASDAEVRRALCGALTRQDLPREVLVETLIPLERLGCVEPEALARVARSYGPRPGGVELSLTIGAARALGRSHGRPSGRALLALAAYFPPRGAPRAAALQAIESRRAELATWLLPEALPVAIEALRSESDQPQTMLRLISLAVALGPGMGPALSRLSRHPNAEVLATAAEAMVVFKRVEALRDLEYIVAGAMNDPRFSPKEGAPDPAVSLARLEKAVAALRRVQ